MRFNSIKEKIRKNLKLLSLTSLVAFGMPGYNYIVNHDVSEKTENVTVLKKADGWYASSQMKIYLRNGSVVIDKDELWDGYTRLSDGNHDGNLDDVKFQRPFFRTFDFNTRFDYGLPLEISPEVMEKEDKIYKKDLEEFVDMYRSKYGREFERLGLL